MSLGVENDTKCVHIVYVCIHAIGRKLKCSLSFHFQIWLCTSIEWMSSFVATLKTTFWFNIRLEYCNSIGYFTCALITISLNRKYVECENGWGQRKWRDVNSTRKHYTLEFCIHIQNHTHTHTHTHTHSYSHTNISCDSTYNNWTIDLYHCCCIAHCGESERLYSAQYFSPD